MSWYFYVIAAYLLVLMGFNIYRSRKVKTQDDMMVAGRSLGYKVMVFTLICTWIGSGTFISGAEFAAKAGWSSLWLPAGAWAGIVVIYFLAAKIRTFGQYTIGDILEVRYGKFARIFGAIAIIISFVAIVSYQFKAGGFVLNIVSNGNMSVETGQFLTFLFVTGFVALAGMMAVAYTDLPNGIIILVACVFATPFVYFAAGGWEQAAAILPEQHFSVINNDFGHIPPLKFGAYFLATMLLLMGVQSMYQKFYSAKTPKDAKQGVALWIVGMVIVETVVIVMAVFAASKYWNTPDGIQTFINSGGESGLNPASLVLKAAKDLVPGYVGVLLLAAACVVVLSTGMNYLLSPSTNIMRDIYQRFISPDASPKTMIILQKVTIIILGCIAYFLCTKLTSVLEMAFFAYTIYGVAITPAVIAALGWKRATKSAGVASITSGTVVALSMYIYGFINPSIMLPAGSDNADPWGIPIIYPALIVSLATLFIVSYMTKAPTDEELKDLFPEKS
jgi:SSS family solute:Na+ symporter/sodium/proline symporter